VAVAITPLTLCWYSRCPQRLRLRRQCVSGGVSFVSPGKPDDEIKPPTLNTLGFLSGSGPGLALFTREVGDAMISEKTGEVPSTKERLETGFALLSIVLEQREATEDPGFAWGVKRYIVACELDELEADSTQ